jgi:hypothetical protein
VSGYVPLGIGILWVAKRIFVAWAEHQAERKKAEAKGLMQFSIMSSVEKYTPQPLAEGLRCKVVVQGTDRRIYQGRSHTRLDAAYLIRGGEYSRHHSFLLDGSPAVLFEEDLSAHIYSFAYTGSGRQLSVSLRFPEGINADRDNPKLLEVTIHTLSATEEAKVKTLAEEQQRAAAVIQREELSRRALELATAAHVEQANFLDPTFQQSFAQKHTSRILNTLSREWLTEYQEILSNEALFTLLQEQHPHVLKYFEEGRFAVVRIAQKLAVEPAPPSDPEPQRKETPEEYLERKRRRLRNNAQLKLAKILERLEAARKLREQAEEVGSAEDVTESLVNELLLDFADDEDDSSNGFRQV